MGPVWVFSVIWVMNSFISIPDQPIWAGRDVDAPKIRWP